MKNIILSLFLLPALFSFFCYSYGSTNKRSVAKRKLISKRQNRVIGEYLVTVRRGSDYDHIKIIKGHFADYTVIRIIRIKNDLYKIKIKNDPGPREIEKKGLQSREIVAVQPNYVYRVLKVHNRKLN